MKSWRQLFKPKARPLYQRKASEARQSALKAEHHSSFNAKYKTREASSRQALALRTISGPKFWKLEKTPGANKVPGRKGAECGRSDSHSIQVVTQTHRRRMSATRDTTPKQAAALRTRRDRGGQRAGGDDGPIRRRPALQRRAAPRRAVRAADPTSPRGVDSPGREHGLDRHSFECLTARSICRRCTSPCGRRRASRHRHRSRIAPRGRATLRRTRGASGPTQPLPAPRFRTRKSKLSSSCLRPNPGSRAPPWDSTPNPAGAETRPISFGRETTSGECCPI